MRSASAYESQAKATVPGLKGVMGDIRAVLSPMNVHTTSVTSQLDVYTFNDLSGGDSVCGIPVRPCACIVALNLIQVLQRC